MAPANTKKEGPVFDLPIAVGILINFGEISQKSVIDTVFIGEVSLDGKINNVNGILPMCIEAKNLGMKKIIVPKENAKEAAVVEGIETVGVENLKQVVKYLNKKQKIEPEKANIEELFSNNKNKMLDFEEVKGQENIKRALEVAAARTGTICLWLVLQGVVKQ